jgi:hypothetical protein
MRLPHVAPREPAGRPQSTAGFHLYTFVP